jgi:hypothetical protein|uniref:Glycosyltransferase n=1 Tax=viral metagenome TaxID=1070528 RepID=A0A6C0C1B8_9ZZZZ
MINWITSFYLTNNIERQREIDKCLNKNIENNLIKKIYLFVDDKKAYKYLIDNFNIDKIKYYILNRISLYSDYFKCANMYCKNQMCMISNNDIWLGEVKSMDLIENFEKNMVYALTRHEYNLEPKLQKELKFGGSADSFLFYSPVPNEITNYMHFPQNVWGSENVVMFELWYKNYKLYNPCYNIMIIHEHKDESRPKDRIRINVLPHRNLPCRSVYVNYSSLEDNTVLKMKKIAVEGHIFVGYTKKNKKGEVGYVYGKNVEKVRTYFNNLQKLAKINTFSLFSQRNFNSFF